MSRFDPLSVLAACLANPTCSRALLAGSAATVLALSKWIENIEVPSSPFPDDICPSGDPGDFFRLCMGGCRSVYKDDFIKRMVCIVGCVITALK